MHLSMVANIFSLLAILPASLCSCSPMPAEVTEIGFIMSASVNWDDDPEPDGIAFALRPQDTEGFMVEAEGNLNAKLWSQPNVFTENKGELIQEWNGMQVINRDYDKKDLAARIRLEYEDYMPALGEWGILEVIFVSPQGKNFTFTQNNISLNPRQGLTQQLAPGCCP